MWREVVVIAALVGTAMPLSATTLIRAGLEELTTTNHTVVVAEVLETQSYWNAEGSFILTDVRLEPIEFIKGNRPHEEFTITVMGGTVGDLTALIVGGPELAARNSYVLFLDQGNLPGAKGVLTVRDLSQGVFDIVGEKSGLRAVSQARIPLVADSRGLREPPGGAVGIPLDAMLGSVRSLAEKKEVQK